MKDQRGRNVTYLRLSVTEQCPLRCRYCRPEADPGPRREACGAAELVEIVRQAAALGVRKVRLTGGEPLAREDILDICRSIGAVTGIRELCLTTNGLALGRLAGPLREAGVRRLNVSLDSLRPERYAWLTRGGRLEEVFRGLEAAAEAGFKGLKLNVVLLKGFNEDELPAFVELTRRYSIDVRFIERMPMGPGLWEAFLPAGAVLEACPALEPVGTQGVAETYHLPGGRGLVGLIAPLSRPFCAACDRVRVTADGMLKPCLHSPEEIPLRGLSGEALRQAIAGGIRAKPPGHHLEEASRAGRLMVQIGG